MAVALCVHSANFPQFADISEITHLAMVTSLEGRGGRLTHITSLEGACRLAGLQGGAGYIYADAGVCVMEGGFGFSFCVSDPHPWSPRCAHMRRSALAAATTP